MIYTGAMALYEQNLISYCPKIITVVFKIKTNTTNYQKKYKLELQNEEIINIGVIEKNGKKMYCPERLFIEFNKFQLENTIKKEAWNNLLKRISPEKVKKIYSKIGHRRNKLDHKSIRNFLDQNLLNIKEKIKNSENPKSVIREYIMALIYKNKTPICLIKGGSAIQLFTNLNRATDDIDSHTGRNNIDDIIKILTNKELDIYFKLTNDSNESINKFKEKNKKILKLKLLPISKGGALKKIINNVISEISFNTSLNDLKIKEIIDSYKISPQKLKILTNAKALFFTKEMLLAEKLYSIIFNPTLAWRTKDLLDIGLLWDGEINKTKFKKWFFKKGEYSRKTKSKEECLKEINENKVKKLIKIKENFNETINMYNANEENLSFDHCYKIYKKLISFFE